MHYIPNVASLIALNLVAATVELNLDGPLPNMSLSEEVCGNDGFVVVVVLTMLNGSTTAGKVNDAARQTRCNNFIVQIVR